MIYKFQQLCTLDASTSFLKGSIHLQLTGSQQSPVTCRRRPRFDFVHDGLSEDAERVLTSLQAATQDNIDEGLVHPEGEDEPHPAQPGDHLFKGSDGKYEEEKYEDYEEEKGWQGGMKRGDSGGLAERRREEEGLDLEQGHSQVGLETVQSIEEIAVRQGRRRRPRPPVLHQNEMTAAI
jgi:hypothetical protein